MSLILPMIAVMLVPVVADLHIEADELEIRRETVTARGSVRLSAENLTLDATHLQLGRRPGCKGRTLYLDQPELNWAHQGRLRSDHLHICHASREIYLNELSFVQEQAVLTAASGVVNLDSKSLTLRTGQLNTCGCERPPWSITFRSAHADTDGVWLNWPIVKLGSVPVLAMPAWYIPYGSRRSGLLAPSLGLEDGSKLSVQQPVYWVMGPESDLTLWGGIHAAEYPIGGAELRWLGSAGQLNTMDVELVGYEVRAQSRAVHHWGLISLSLTGEALTTFKERHRFTRPWQQRLIADTLARGILSIGGRSLAMDLAGQLAQTSRGTPTHPLQGWGDARLIWMPELDGTEPSVDGRVLYGGDRDGKRFGRVELGGEVASRLWLGPVAFRPYVGGSWTRNLAASAVSYSHVLGYESSIGLTRTHRRGHQRLDLILDGSWGRGFNDPESEDPWIRPGSRHTHGLNIVSLWSQSGRYVRLRLRQGMQIPTTGDPFLDVPGGELVLSSPVVQATCTQYGTDYVWSELTIRPIRGGRAGLGYVRVREGSRKPPWTRWKDRYRYARFQPAYSESDSLMAHGSIELGPVRLYWAPGVDLRYGTFIGQAGGLEWTGRCRCWSMKIDVQHDRSARLPNVLLDIDLGRP